MYLLLDRQVQWGLHAMHCPQLGQEQAYQICKMMKNLSRFELDVYDRYYNAQQTKIYSD